MPLTTKQKQQLKARAHKLRPIVLIGANGLTPAVQNEIERALQDHELIKVRMATEDRELRQAWLTEVCRILFAEIVQIIGKIGILYRKRIEK